MEPIKHLITEFRLLAYGVAPQEFEYAKNITDPGEDVTISDLQAHGAIPNYTVRAIPIFFIAIAVELVIGLLRGRKVYRINDFISSILLGATMLVIGLWIKILKLGVYVYIYNHFRLVDLPVVSWNVWVGLFLGIDLGYYWMHRTAHTYHFMWAAHSVHHSGEDYNLATALRQGALQGATSWIFYLPLALFAHPACYAGHAMLNTLGQFWIHTQEIGDCGIFEYVLNTPSHHRMHHRPPGNCNYGALLIIWDRMFGTFKSEKEHQNYYGLAKQYETFDPLWANVEHVKRVLNNGVDNKTSNYVSRCMNLFKRRVKHKFVFEPMNVLKPLPKPNRSRWVVPKSDKRQKLDTKIPITFKLYSLIQFVLILVCALVVLINERYYTKFQMMTVSIVLLYSFSSIGRVLDGSEIGLVMETIRIVVVPFLLNMNVTEEQWISIFKKPCVGCVILWGIVLFLGKGKMDKIRTE
jgi:sterol desaturase/sphingolipid hydroxylase (fatty acid hydroxylase superfamily)